MRKTILILLVLLGPLSINAQDLTWHTDVKKASEISIKEKKPLMFFFTGSDWCGWCMRLQKEVFQTPEFTKWAKENVILVELDFPKRKALTPELQKQNRDLEQMFGIRGYPTVWFVNPNKKDGQIAFERLGSTNYVAGGPSAWATTVNPILKK